ncbi:MAG: hypothetical protein HRU28_13770 [Rhizobiales bacterium]|nr:hypothetical protein [Hyphomicrobiales bacterium]
MLNNYYLKVLKEPNKDDYKKLFIQLEEGASFKGVYFNHLKNGLDWANRFFEGPAFKGPEYVGTGEKTFWDKFWGRIFFRNDNYIKPNDIRDDDWKPNPFSLSTYIRCYQLATVYPVLGAFIFWGVGNDAGLLGETLGLSTTINALFSKVVLAITIAVIILSFLGYKTQKERYFYAAFALLVSSVYLVELIFSETLPIVAIAVAIAVAVAGVYNRENIVLLIFSILYFVATIIFIFTLANKNLRGVAIIMAIIIIPMINAPFDYLSIGLTRSLLGKSLKTGSGITKLGWSVLDIFLAIILLIVLSSAFIFTIEIINWLATFSGLNKPIVNLEILLKEISHNFWSWKHGWVYFMFL